MLQQISSASIEIVTDSNNNNIIILKSCPISQEQLNEIIASGFSLASKNSKKKLLVAKQIIEKRDGNTISTEHNEIVFNDFQITMGLRPIYA